MAEKEAVLKIRIPAGLLLKVETVDPADVSGQSSEQPEFKRVSDTELETNYCGCGGGNCTC